MWASLQFVGRTCNQNQVAIGPQDQALKERIATGVIAGKVIHALLLEEQYGIQTLLCHLLASAPSAPGKLVLGKMQNGHERSPG